MLLRGSPELATNALPSVSAYCSTPSTWNNCARYRIFFILCPPSTQHKHPTMLVPHSHTGLSPRSSKEEVAFSTSPPILYWIASHQQLDVIRGHIYFYYSNLAGIASQQIKILVGLLNERTENGRLPYQNLPGAADHLAISAFHLNEAVTSARATR